jgi:hypothetical protein
MALHGFLRIWQLVEFAHHHIVVLVDILIFELIYSKVRLRLHHGIVSWMSRIVHVYSKVNWLEKLDSLGIVWRLIIHGASVLLIWWRGTEDAFIVTNAAGVLLAAHIKTDPVHATSFGLID